MRRHRAMSRTSSSDALAILTVDASGIDLSFPERLERDPVRVDRRRDAGIQRDHQADFADLVGCAAVGERAVDVDLELGGPVDRRVHPKDDQTADFALEAGPRPDVAVRVGVDHVLQRRAEFAERAHALLDRFGSEELLADGEPATVEFLGVHGWLLLVGEIDDTWLASRVRRVPRRAHRFPRRPGMRAELSDARGQTRGALWPGQLAGQRRAYGRSADAGSARPPGDRAVRRLVGPTAAGALANGGTAEVARAAPDGYTILLTTNTPHAANVALFKSLPFDPVKDFAPIVRLITTSMVLLVRSDFPASTLKDFIAHAKAKPNGLTAGYGSAATIVSIAKLRTAAGFKTLDVPYKGVPLAITDVLGGQVDFTLGDLAVSMPQIHGGKMKGLGVTSPQRSPLAPELPAIAETFPGYETRIWYGLVAPANTPKAVVAKGHDVVTASLAKPDVKARLAGLGLQPAPMPPPEVAAFIRQEIPKGAKGIRA